MCQWFAQTQLVVTFEREGVGKFSDEDIENYTIRDDKGRITGLDFPTKFVLIANHQVSQPADTCFRNHPSISPHPIDLCRLVVRVVLYLLPESSGRNSPIHLHHFEEEFAMGTRGWLGMYCSEPLATLFSL